MTDSTGYVQLISRVSTCIIAGALLLGACGGKQLTQAPPAVDLAGTWRYSAGETAAARAAAPDSAGPQRGGRGDPGAAGGRIRTRGGAGGMAAMTGTVPPRPVEQFTIIQSDSQVTIRFAAKNSVTVPTSGRRVTAMAWPGVGEVQVSARWTDEGLQLERAIPNAGSVTELLSRESTERLDVRTEIRSTHGRQVLRYVYLRVD